MACDKCMGFGYFIETDPSVNEKSTAKKYCYCSVELESIDDLPKDFKLYCCPDCGFSFDANHKDDDELGGYTCPLCELDGTRKGIRP